MKTTGNLGLKKPEGTDIVDINDLNGNMDILDTAVKAAQDHAADTVKHITTAERTAWNAKASTTVATTAAAGLMAAADKVLSTNLSSLPTTTGTATAYLAEISAGSTLVAGLRFSFKAHVASGTNPTINPNALGAKAVKNPDGTAASFALNGVYTVVYDGTAFQLQGKGGGIDLNGTNAVPAQVLVGKTFLSSNSAGIQTGTMQNYDGMSQAGVLANPGVGAAYATIPSAGFYGTTSEIGLYDADFVSQNIKSGVNIFGVTGTYSGSGGTYITESFQDAYGSFEFRDDYTLGFKIELYTTRNFMGRLRSCSIASKPDLMNNITCDNFLMKFGGAVSDNSIPSYLDFIGPGDNNFILTRESPHTSIGTSDYDGTITMNISRYDFEPDRITIHFQYNIYSEANFQYNGYPVFDVVLGGLF
ncbi:hypothetical protein NST04_33410 [Paenibacillus sp. FSL H7-0756]|uniref:hypothetical protein n=1 Tax=Paenibacillus sp. FSL H7-0756 TaxID=2954738 RepID=UPI0030F99D25